MVEADLEVDEVEEEEAAVDSEEDGDEAAEEDFKDCIEWADGKFDDHYDGNGGKTRIWKEDIILRMFALLGHTERR